jgi:hypothetical protein
VFDLTVHLGFGTGGDGTTDVVRDFSSQDLLYLGSVQADNYALSTFQVVNGNGAFLLEDGTKVVLDGVTNLSAGNFKV